MAILTHIKMAGERARQFVAGRSFDEYRSDLMLHSAVERQFEILGEAMSQIRRRDSVLLQRFTDHHAIIAFRNVLIHAYSVVDHDKVWDILENKLPQLIAEVRSVIAEGEAASKPPEVDSTNSKEK